MENNNEITVLIIDDSLEDREAFKRFLSKSNEITYQFLEAETGENGLEIFKSHKPDCVLLDFQLPDTDGISFINEMVNEHNLNDIPIILLTGHGDEKIAAKSMKAGAQDYLVKDSLNTDILTRSIRYAIEKKQTEKALKESEIKYRQIHTNSFDGIIIANTGDNVIEVNPKAEIIFGYKTGEMVGLKIENLMPERFRKSHLAGMKRFLETGKGKYLGTLLELEGLRKNGDIFPIELIVNSFTVNENIYFTGNIRDITERKLAEKTLKNERQKLFTLLEELPAFVYLQAQDHSVPFANRYFKELFGDPTGRACYNILRERKEPCEECPTFCVFDTKTPLIWEWAQTPNGRVYQIYDYPFTDTDGTPLVLELGIDITENKLAQKQIEASLIEKEVLLKEIHHRVKNNMQVISSLLKLQAGTLKDENLIEILKESQNRIKAMSLIHEKLYRSEDIANIDFGDYIKNLANDLFRFYNISTAKIKLKMDAGDVFINIDTAIPCGLIINELISNSLKYAFPEGKEGEIKISLHKITDMELQNADLKSEVRNPKSEMIELIVSDNGVGIPEDIDYRNTESLGLRLITNLTEHQLGGKVELNRDKGTEFRIRFNEVKYKERI